MKGQYHRTKFFFIAELLCKMVRAKGNGGNIYTYIFIYIILQLSELNGLMTIYIRIGAEILPIM